MSYGRQLSVLFDVVIGKGVADPAVFKAGSMTPHKRLNVYADGYGERLRGATCADYPALRHLMGKEAFEALVAEYVAVTPSYHWDLNLYPVRLADFMQNYHPKQIDLAKLEAAIAKVFWLPDSEALLPEHLTVLSEEALAETVFCLRTASKLLSFNYIVNDYLTGFRAGETLKMRSGPQYLMVVRHNNEIHRHTLEPAEFELLSRMTDGLNFSEALEVCDDPSALLQQLSHYLSHWLNKGFLLATV